MGISKISPIIKRNKSISSREPFELEKISIDKQSFKKLLLIDESCQSQSQKGFIYPKLKYTLLTSIKHNIHTFITIKSLHNNWKYSGALLWKGIQRKANVLTSLETKYLKLT